MTVFVDCSTQDIERLEAEINKLSVEFQQVQLKITEGMEPRDQMIVVNASLEQLREAASRAGKKSTTPRFIRSIGSALTVARKFGTGKTRSGGV